MIHISVVINKLGKIRRQESDEKAAKGQEKVASAPGLGSYYSHIALLGWNMTVQVC